MNYINGIFRQRTALVGEVGVGYFRSYNDLYESWDFEAPLSALRFFKRIPTENRADKTAAHPNPDEPDAYGTTDIEPETCWECDGSGYSYGTCPTSVTPDRRQEPRPSLKLQGELRMETAKDAPGLDLEKLEAMLARMSGDCAPMVARAQFYIAIERDLPALIAAARKYETAFDNVGKMREAAERISETGRLALDAANARIAELESHLSIYQRDFEERGTIIAAANARVEVLIKAVHAADETMHAIVENDPDECIADGGITVWHGVERDARRWIENHGVQWKVWADEVYSAKNRP